MSNCRPALLVANGGTTSYKAHEELPDADEVRDIVVTALEGAGWGSGSDMIHDIREEETLIQHEVPPTDPYEAYAVVITFGQIPITDYNRHREGPFRFSNIESPLFAVIEALPRELDEVEVWLDGSDAGSGHTSD